MAVIRYRFLDRSSSQSPIHHIFDPSYTYCTTSFGKECSIDRICLRIDIEVEHRNNIDYAYWISYALKQNGINPGIGSYKINPANTSFYMTIYNQRQANTSYTWKIPLIGNELIFATSVPRNGYWRVMFTFVFKDDNLGNTYIGNAYDDFSESPSDVWECQNYKFPDAYITFTGIDAPNLNLVCPGPTCAIVPSNI